MEYTEKIAAVLRSVKIAEVEEILNVTSDGP